MDHLDYHDLRAFWAVVREGSMAAAAGALHVSRPAVSMRVRALEQALGSQLFERRGRALELTEAGELVFGYADDIFRLGRELGRSVDDGSDRRWRTLRVGVVQSLPKLTAFEQLEPIASDLQLQLVCRQGSTAALFTDLCGHRVDVVLTDEPPTDAEHAALRHHPLGESPIGIFAAAPLAARLRPTFPASLAQAPMLLPSRGQSLRRLFDSYCERAGVEVHVAGEFDDSALLKVFGEAGRGAFPAPVSNTRSIGSRYSVELVGELAGVVERFYAVTGERRLQHPAVERLVGAGARGQAGAPPSQSAGTTSPS